MNLLITTVVFVPAIVVAGYVSRRAWLARDSPGGRYLFYTYTGLLVWLVCYAIEVNLATRQFKILVAQVEYIGIVTSPVLYALFAAEYTRGFRPSKQQLVTLFTVPGLTLILVWTNPIHNLVWTNYEILQWNGLFLATRQFGPWFYVHLAYSYAAFLVGLVLFVDIITDRNFFFRRQSAAILAGSLVPICTALIYPLGFSPVPGFDFVPFGLAINGALFGYAFFATEFYDIIPAVRAVGWERMADQIDSGIIVTDMNTTIIEVNETLQEMFDIGRDEVIGQPMTVLFENTEVDESIAGAYEFERAEGGVYEVKCSSVRDYHGHRIGLTYTVTDITDRKRREQQLQVLNRALRHNLRNKTNVISAYSERIERTAGDAESHDGDLTEIREDAANITRAAGRINEIGETARHMENLIQETSVKEVNLADTLEDAIESVMDQYPEARVVNEVTGPITIEGRNGIEHAFTQILKNAFQHNDPSETTVTITEEPQREQIRLRFSDDGDGIPDHELQIIRNGSENQLEHGSGLGLWFIKWVTEASHGEFDLDTGPEGTTISLTLKTKLDNDT